MRQSLSILVIITVAASADADTLYPGQYLFPGQEIVSPFCYWHLQFQPDGNLVIYDVAGSPLWATGTNGSGAAYATMQSDGNLVLYRMDGHPVWATGTDGWGTAHLAMQDDGNLVIYWGDWAIWASDTNVGWRQSRDYCPPTSFTLVQYDTNYFGGDFTSFDVYDNRPLECASACAQNARCDAYTFVPPGIQGPYARCWLKDSIPASSYAPGLVSGVVAR
jgi:hypothetical protein